MWENELHFSKSFIENNTFNFLNIKHEFKDRIDWNYNQYGKLWTYNLNYFDFLNQKEITKSKGVSLIVDFIKNDTVLKDAKEPYPTSLRTINWIKFLSKNSISNSEINQSLYNHYQILLHNLEYHLLGNHLLENAFSLFFGGYYFNDKTLSKKAEIILRSELSEQLLEDGAHFELSPMYHQILLYRLLDCISLAQQNKNGSSNSSLIIFLQKKAVKMLAWLETITFNNSSIPMVNDSAYQIAMSSQQLFDYAKRLKLQWSKTQLSDSGYRKFSTDNYEIFMDVGQLAVSYQPGHAHADTFSFILHASNQPIIVDPGLSTYEINATRERERSTVYHNTVSINDKNSSQVWSGFRVAKRAKVNLSVDKKSKIEALHNGYANHKHTRQFSVENETFTIKDSISKSTEVKAYFHFHPDCKLCLERDKNRLLVNNIEITFSENINIELEDYNFCNGFNKTVIAKKVVVLFSEKLVTNIKVI
jgi:hypothetical protein